MQTGMAGRLGWGAFGIVVMAFLLSPLVIVVVFSFGQNRLATFPFGGFTLEWYRALFDNANFWTALKNSLVVTGVTGVISTITGTLAAMALASMRPGRASAAMMMLSLPVMIPPLVLALALATSFSGLGLTLGLHTVIPSHLVFTQPFVILIVYAQMERFDFSVLDSARDLGASPLLSFFTITLPIIRPTLIGAALIAMSVSLDDFVITFFTIGNGMTLPTLVWGMLRTSLDPSINALGTLILVATIGSSVIALSLTRYRG
ncbi:MAG: ABC transporter permease [Rhizobiaceae bacterium]|nr:ABC transporter permease [Rhizobiaceae bacterium]